MNGMAELDSICKRCKTIMCDAHYGSKCECYNIIKRELQVKQILKEKRVDLHLLEHCMDLNNSLDGLSKMPSMEYIQQRYNTEYMAKSYMGEDCYMLTLEEITIIVEDLKEKNKYEG